MQELLHDRKLTWVYEGRRVGRNQCSLLQGRAYLYLEGKFYFNEISFDVSHQFKVAAVALILPNRREQEDRLLSVF